MEKYGEEGGDRAENAEDVLRLHSRLLVPGQPVITPCCSQSRYSMCACRIQENNTSVLQRMLQLHWPVSRDQGMSDKWRIFKWQIMWRLIWEVWFCAWLGYYVCNMVQAVIETFPAALSSLVWVPWYSLTHLLSQYNLPYCEECLFSSTSLKKFCKAVKADYLWDI